MSDLETLYDKKAIRSMVEALAERISLDYAGKDLVLVGVLRAAAPFLSDLSLAISLPVELDFMEASSYGDGTSSGGTVKLVRDLDRDIAGRHVLLVDCIVDSGRTMLTLMDILLARHPASIEAVALLDKRACRKVDVPVKYVGTEVPDRFLVGYGLDKAQMYRNLPYVAALKNTD